MNDKLSTAYSFDKYDPSHRMKRPWGGRVPQMEPCPPHLQHLDKPRYGGNLDYNSGTGLSGCVRCGWKGIPTISAGIISSHCPACTGEDDPIHAQGRNGTTLRRRKNKAAKKARKKNRR